MNRSELETFAAIARRFCKRVESGQPGIDPDQARIEALRALAELYAGAVLLSPLGEPGDADDAPSMTEARRSELAAKLSWLPFQYYWEIFAPTELEGEQTPTCGDLFDDFLDIYDDLERGLWHFDCGDGASAAWEWKFRFDVHWGRHVVSAMHALHCHETATGAGQPARPMA